MNSKKIIPVICLSAIILNPFFLLAQNNRKKINDSLKLPISNNNDKKDVSDLPIYYLKHEVKIGDQIWLDVNLDVDHFKNGDPIIQAKTPKEWYDANMSKQPAWCYFDNKLSNGKIYGKLYNWYAVSDKRGLAPDGWHIPSYDEWTKLADYLGGYKVAGAKMKSTKVWVVKPGTNESGFSALPGGGRRSCYVGEPQECNFNWLQIGGKEDETAMFWSTTPIENNGGYPIWFVTLQAAIYRKPNSLEFGYTDRGNGMSVRCVKD